MDLPQSLRTARRIVVAVVGATLLLAGLAMLLLPGPGLVVIPIGLAVLSTEFLWARRWLTRVRQAIGPSDSQRARSEPRGQDQRPTR